MKRFLAFLIPLLFLVPLHADKGMWLFEAFPKDKVKAKYGFEVTQPWLDHVRLSSVRFNNGGSGEFVSPDGLVMTNQHIGQECLNGLSTKGKDLLQTGFYATTRAEEPRCPDLELNVLEKIEDVTQRVQGAAKAGMSPAEAGQAQRAEVSAIEKACTARSGLRCDVVTLYSGGMYHLYGYKKYTDVRLVFTPEFDIAFFGGDPDNFEYPSYHLDVTFFRVYENGQPAHLKDWLKWSPNGVKDGDLVFVSGYPGSTGRLLTMAQLEVLRDMVWPWRLMEYNARLRADQAYASQSAENARRAQEDIFDIENNIKRSKEYLGGLKNPKLMDKKRAEEDTLKQFATEKKLGDPWSQIQKAMDVERGIYKPLVYLDQRNGFRGDLAGFARTLVRGAQQRKLPNGGRLPEYRDSALPSLQQNLFSPAPIYKDFETVQLTESLDEMRQQLGADNPVIKRVLGEKTPEEVAKLLIEGTKLEDVALRKQLWNGGEAAVTASRDPLIELMRQVEPEALKVRKEYDDQVDSVERTRGAVLAKIRLEQGGLSEPPDATFTLRLSYGAIRGYIEDGRGTVPAGTKLEPWTTIGGAFKHASDHANKPPYKLPESWMKFAPGKTEAKQLDHNTPLNNVSTADITGGNSGSPLVNTKGELVGIIFDENMQALPSRYVYDDTLGRSISVDSRGIMEALRVVYGAKGLADELSGKK
jgi:Peptidase S46